MKGLLLVLMFGVALLVNAQQKDYRSFIPNNYDTLYGGVARGDLNKDGLEDVVLALYHKNENDTAYSMDEDSIPERKLIILLASKIGFVKSAESTNPLLCKNCGGAFGDPFAGIEINRSILIVNHYAGSSWRWYYVHKFRLQNNAWYLIGQTKGSYWLAKECEELGDFAGAKYEDINFVTGEYERKEISDECVLIENKKGRNKIKPLKTITSFSFDN